MLFVLKSFSGYALGLYEFVKVGRPFFLNGGAGAADLEKIGHFIVASHVHSSSIGSRRTVGTPDLVLTLCDAFAEGYYAEYVYHAAAGRASGDPMPAASILAVGLSCSSDRSQNSSEMIRKMSPPRLSPYLLLSRAAIKAC